MLTNNGIAKQSIKSNAELLPDLKFTAFNVTSTPYIDSGRTRYRLNTTYTIKNDGTAPIFTDNVIVQAFITTEEGLTKELRFTSYFTAAGGHILSDVAGRNETLAPGVHQNNLLLLPPV